MMSLFRRRKSAPELVPIEVPERYGKRPGFSELKAALEGRQEHPVVRAFVHLMMLRRTAASLSARGAARADKPSAFDLGGVDYLDELFSDLDALIQGQEPAAVLKEWFAEDDVGQGGK